MEKRQKADIVFIRTIRLGSADPRLIKEAALLKQCGYKVIILAWDRDAKHKGKEIIDGICWTNFALKAPIASPSVVFYYPIFWIWIFNKIISLRPGVIHACNLDSALIAYLCWKLGLCGKFVFDIFDTFMFFVSHSNKRVSLKSHLFLKTIYALENYLFYVADAGIIPSKTRGKLYTRFNQKEIAVILNSPPDILRNLRKRETVRKNRFSVTCAGNLHRGRGILELIKATRNLGVDLILAGLVLDHSILSECKKHKHVKYLGILSYSDSLKLEATSDCLVALYDPLTFALACKFAEPQKIYEAMMLGKPIITNVKRDVIEGYRCGITVSYGNIDELRSAIKFLKENPKVAYEMGLNGRKAYEDCFNWSKQREKLINTYRRLLNGA